MLLDCSGKTEPVSEEVLEAIIAGFEYACKAGPLCGEPVRHLKVNLVDLQLSQSSDDGSEVMRGVGKAVFGCFLTADPVLLEPIYKIIIICRIRIIRRILKNPEHADAEKSLCLSKKDS